MATAFASGASGESWKRLEYYKTVQKLWFYDHGGWKEASSHEAVLCEKAFLLWNLGGSRAESYFINLLENAKCRDVLEKEYHFTPNDFYVMNKEE